MTRSTPAWMRRPRRVAAWLLLGLVTTVGLAWISALTVRPREVTLRPPPLAAERFAPWFWGGTYERHSETPDVKRVAAVLATDGPSALLGAINWTKGTEARGWPWRALSCRVVFEESVRSDPAWHRRWQLAASTKGDFGYPSIASASSRPPLRADGALVIASPTSRAANPDLGAILLPLVPNWPALAGDAAIYAAAFWGLHALAAAVRRGERRASGRCTACGYDLAWVTGPCPECGTEQLSR